MPKITEQSEETVKISKKELKEVTKKPEPEDLKPVLLSTLKTMAGQYFEFSEQLSEVNNGVMAIQITSLVNRFTKGISCGDLLVNTGSVNVKINGIDTVHEFKKSADLTNICRAILTDSLDYLEEVSKKKKSEEVKLEVEKLKKKIEEEPNTLIEDLDEDAYHTGPGVSTSMLKELKKSCKNLDRYLVSKKEPTKDMKLGSALHDLVLRPSLFDSLNYVAPDVSKQSNEGKFIHLLNSVVNFGKRDISAEDLQTITLAKDSLYSHPFASIIISEGVTELSFYCKIKPNGCEREFISRGRTDGIIIKPSKKLIKEFEKHLGDILDNSIIIYDLKLLRDNGDEDEQMGGTFYKTGYHLQAYNNSNLMETLTGRPVVFVFITISKDGTFDVVPAKLDTAAEEVGELEINNLRKKYSNQFLAKGNYRGRTAGIVSVSFPAYVLSKHSLNNFD